MTEFPLLVKRIYQLWDLFAELENILYLSKSKTPEIAADQIKREIIKLQEYARKLNKQ